MPVSVNLLVTVVRMLALNLTAQWLLKAAEFDTSMFLCSGKFENKGSSLIQVNSESSS